MNPCALAKKVLHFPFSSAAVSSLGTLCPYYIYFLELLVPALAFTAFLYLSPYPCLTSFKWDQGGKRNHSLERVVRYNNRNKILYSERNDRQLASSEPDCSPGVLPLFSMRSELGIWLRWELDWGHVFFSSRLSQNSGVFKSGFPLLRPCNAWMYLCVSWLWMCHVGRALGLRSPAELARGIEIVFVPYLLASSFFEDMPVPYNGQSDSGSLWCLCKAVNAQLLC